MKPITTAFLFLLLSLQAFSQNTDSLKTRLDAQMAAHPGENPEFKLQDSLIVHTLNHLSEAYWNIDQHLAMDYAEKTLKISEQIDYEPGIASAYHSMGTIQNNMGDYTEAIRNFEKGLAVATAINNHRQMANTQNNLGTSYMALGKFPQALKSFLKALRYYDQNRQMESAAGCELNIGILYTQLGENEKALSYFERARQSFEELDNDYGRAFVYGSIGQLYTAMNQHEKSLEADSIALVLSRKIGNKYGISNALNNLASDYEKLGDIPKALDYFMQALEINREIDNKGSMAMNHHNIGSIYTRLKKIPEAEYHFAQSLALSTEIGSMIDMSLAYRNMSSLDSLRGNFQGALSNYKNYIMARDSMFSEENTQELTELQMTYEFEKKETAAQAEQEKKDALTAKELEKQRLVRNGFAGGFVVVLLFAAIFFTQRNRIKQGKKRSDELLLNILPAEIAQELKEKGRADARDFDMVSIIFSDFKGFTELSAQLTAKDLVAEINTCFEAFDNLMGKYKIEKIKTIGDAYMAAGGLPLTSPGSVKQTVLASLEMQQFIIRRKTENDQAGKPAFEMRIGIHSGPVVAGIVGVKKFQYDIWGDTVNTASRMESNGEPGKVNISQATYDLLKSDPDFVFEHRGEISAKGKGAMHMYFVSLRVD